MIDLNESIENLYATFKDVPQPTHILACPCCIDDSTLNRLISTPVRDISASDLSPYASSAFLTAGEIEDYPYFLPRILELTISEYVWWPDIEVTGRAIRESKLDVWPEHRKRCLQSFFEAVLRSFLSAQDYYEIDSWICGAARAGLEIRPLLEIVQTNDDAVLEFFNANSGTLVEGKLGNAFWEPTDAGQDVIIEWLKSDAIIRIAKDAYGYRT